ncbi:MAG: 16S rRNA (cytidine(1402)-2'-O)-methyltransferase [Bacteroidales bacterium]|nr:16S rRNA (cytidine(1402)-2'-O)-methyltransferase [Bacteroidales bacterium]
MLKKSKKQGKLILVPTPIGNLRDMTYRSVEVLQSADMILAEDTRVSGILFKHFSIETPMTAYHQHNEHKVVEKLTKQLADDKILALITDAGTPAISDPGFLIVREAIEKGVEVECLPGATSIIPALAASGLATDRFYMEGFLPHKKGRKTRLQDIAGRKETIILLESPYRLIKTLEQLMEHCGAERQVCVCRELTKLHEEHVRGTLSEVLGDFQQRQAIKGEIVIVLDGKPKRLRS